MDRTELIKRELTYLFSFDMRLETEQESDMLYATRIHSLAPADDRQKAKSNAPVYSALNELRALGEPIIEGHVQVAQQLVDYPHVSEFAELTGRLVIETEQGELIDANYTGAVTADDRWQLLMSRRTANSKLPDTFETKAFIATRFDTASTRCQWLVAKQCLGYGRLVFARNGQPAFATYDIYAMDVKS